MSDPATISAIVLLTLIALPAIWFGVGMLARVRSDACARRETIGRGRIQLTYDDGPGRTATPELLDLLRQHEAKATFFLIGGSAEQSPELVARIAAEGHTIGWHSQTHRNQWKTDPIRGIADVWRPRGPLAEQPTRPTVFRPPYGKMTLGTVLAAKVRGLPILTWTHVSGDTHEELPDPATIVAKIERDGGGVVLMHDMERPDSARSNFVLDLTGRLIETAESRGWAITTPTAVREGKPQ